MFGRRPRQPTLFELQSQWDDQRARQRVDALRDWIAPQARADTRWLPLALYLAALCLTAFAALTPN